MTNHDFTFRDGTIMLTPFTLEDAETHLRGEDEEIRKWLNEGYVSTLESVQNFILSWKDDGVVFPFAIRTLEDNTLTGMVEAIIDWQVVEGLEEGDANISYCIYPDHRGKGYATRAVNLIRQFLITKGISRAVIRISPDNTNSLKVPQRCGFKQTGEVLTKNEGLFLIFVKEIG